MCIFPLLLGNDLKQAYQPTLTTHAWMRNEQQVMNDCPEKNGITATLSYPEGLSVTPAEPAQAR